MTRKFDKNRSLRPKTKTIFAKKSLGQNFLVDANYIEKIIAALSLNKEER